MRAAPLPSGPAIRRAFAPSRAPAAGLALALGLLAGCPRTPAPSGAAAGPPDAEAPRLGVRAGGVVDTHLHVAPAELATLISVMDESGIAWGLDLSGKWPGGRLEQHLDAARRSRRLLVACNLPWMAVTRPDFPEIGVAVLQESARLGAVALKIEKALGLGVPKPGGGLLPVDDPWLDPIWREAGRLGLPVVIHTADPKAFWRPVDEKNERFEELSAHPGWSNFGVPGVPSFEALLAQFERLVARHPGTRFVGVHFGNHAEDPFAVGAMLDRHPNLYVDLAARLPEIGRHDPERLRALFVRHADRILFGTDTGVFRDGLMLGSYGEQPGKREEAKPYFDAHWRFLESRDPAIPSPTPIQGRWTIAGLGLPDEVLEKIYRRNAERLFGTPEAWLAKPIPAPFVPPSQRPAPAPAPASPQPPPARD